MKEKEGKWFVVLWIGKIRRFCNCILSIGRKNSNERERKKGEMERETRRKFPFPISPHLLLCTEWDLFLLPLLSVQFLSPFSTFSFFSYRKEKEEGRKEEIRRNINKLSSRWLPRRICTKWEGNNSYFLLSFHSLFRSHSSSSCLLMSLYSPMEKEIEKTKGKIHSELFMLQCVSNRSHLISSLPFFLPSFFPLSFKVII